MRRMSAAKVPLSSRSHIESLDAGLSSVNGAREVITQIRSRQLVTKLILGHNELGDDGCETLFRFLHSPQGRGYPVAEISLNSNGIGDRGLLAISEYLKDNVTLKELFLQNNAFAGEPEVVAAFVEALNTSRLETLSLTTNQALGDTFAAQFFPVLDALFLREIQLSVMGLTYHSAPHIIEYLSSSRCRLSTLRVNGNRLGIRGGRGIVRALQRHNFTLTKLEMYANGIADADASSETTGSDDDGAGTMMWSDKQKELDRLLTRNMHLKRATGREALSLLRYARAVLLRPSNDGTGTGASACMALVPSRSPMDSLLSAIAAPYVLSPPEPAFPFQRLPTELQLHTLSFLAPTLSSAQRIRIYTYAASPSTLPPLLPTLFSRENVPDLSTMPLGGIGVGVGMLLRKRVGVSSRAGFGALDGKDGEGAASRKDEERARWLTLMRCNAFELEEDGMWSPILDGNI